MYERNLIPHQSVAGIVATYQQTQKEITKAFGLLDQAKKRLKLTGVEDTVLEINARDYGLHRKCQDSITMLRQNTWCFIIGKCNIKGCLSSSRSLECETEYFAFRWYKKGSLHIRFNRLDLVRRLNKLAGGNSLKSK